MFNVDSVGQIAGYPFSINIYLFTRRMCLLNSVCRGQHPPSLACFLAACCLMTLFLTSFVIPSPVSLTIYILYEEADVKVNSAWTACVT